MNRKSLTVAFVAASLVVVPAVLVSNAQAQDAPIAEVFQKKCMTCHGPVPPKGGVHGPSLKGVYGKKIASTKGYAYSDALKAAAAKGKWTPANLDAYLTRPKAFAPGTKMLPSVGDPAQRKAIIEHLKTVK